MRITVIILLALLVAAGCKDKPDTGKSVNPLIPVQKDTAQFTTIEWIDSVQNYGQIEEGQKLEVIFKFRNAGDKPLVIYMIKPSCGCTLVDQPEKPIAPGEIGEIKGAFNSEGKSGTQHKTIFVDANTKGSTGHNLVFNVEVLKKANP
jgi:hypothetical protein